MTHIPLRFAKLQMNEADRCVKWKNIFVREQFVPIAAGLVSPDRLCEAQFAIYFITANASSRKVREGKNGHSSFGMWLGRGCQFHNYSVSHSRSSRLSSFCLDFPPSRLNCCIPLVRDVHSFTHCVWISCSHDSDFPFRDIFFSHDASFYLTNRSL